MKFFRYLKFKSKPFQDRLFEVTQGIHGDEQSLLLEIAMKDESPGIRMEAVARLCNPKYVAKVAMHNDNGGIRMEAIKNPCFSDLTFLAELIKTDDDAHMRACALEKLFSLNYVDMKLLEEIVNTDENEIVRRLAITRITNQNFLEKVAKTDNDKYMRRHAVWNLSDQNMLTTIANTDKDKDVRTAAEKRLLEIQNNGGVTR